MTRPLLDVADPCLFNEGMPADWEQLAHHVIRRRIQLGYPTRQAFLTVTRLKARTLGDIETARKTGYHAATLNALEHDLQWAAGSIAAILDGGEPRIAASTPPAEQAARATDDDLPDDPILRLIGANLPEDRKKALVRQLLDEQQRFAQRRADELLREAYGHHQATPFGGGETPTGTGR
ncbi:hypothetical protein [Actinoplanes missouriensis]|nr:hypothetical protein [Actinoplanes missouriensis]